MDKFRITEISAVDRPAQAPALAAIIKGSSGEGPRETIRTEAREPVFNSFEAACSHLREQGVHSSSALTKARLRFPDLFQRYQSRLSQYPERPVTKAQPRAVRDFDDIVDGIVAKRRVSRAAALSEARRTHPDAFTAAYGG